MLVTGASGYVGSRLVPALRRAGHDVVATARRPERLTAFDWADDVETAALDVLDERSCRAALAGPRIDVAYYLVHAIGEGDFRVRDRRAAANFGQAARAAGVGRVVYLGGFVPDGEALSDHLDSRAETAEVLIRTGVPVVWLRAAVIIGAGSTSFEIIRYLVDRLPVIPTPGWMERMVQPIAVDDVLYYLVATASPQVPAGGYDIAGEESMPYRELVSRYVKAAGVRRRLLPTPGVAPMLAALVIGRITPVPSALTADLVDSISNTMISQDDRIRDLIPDPPRGLTSVDEAMNRALGRSDDGRPGELPGVGAASDPLHLVATDEQWAGGDHLDVDQQREVRAPAATAWGRIEGIGGVDGFLGWPVTWRLRGVANRIVSGTGIHARRTNPSRLSVGDELDFMTIEDVRSDGYVRLVSAPHAPGQGTLELWVTPVTPDRCTLHLRVRWTPRGLGGRAWWYGLRPIMAAEFPALLRQLGRDAESHVARAV